MGHGYPENLSKFFIRRLYAKGKLSIREATAAAIAAGEKAEASEGAYDQAEMISLFFEIIISALRNHRGPREAHYPAGRADPVIVPAFLTSNQKQLLQKYDAEELYLDGYDDPETKLFDSIKWKFAPGWRAKYPDIPHLTSIEN